MFDNLLFHYDLIKFMFHYKKIKHMLDSAYIPTDSIPKILHYCWFGGNPYSPLIEKCIRSWAICHGFTIKRWDESNFPIEQYPFAQEAMRLKQYAFVADVARLHAIYTEGGIHVDTDVELIKPLDDLLAYGAFACIEDTRKISHGTFGAKPWHPWIGMYLEFYKTTKWRKDYGDTASPRILTKIHEKVYKFKLNGQEVILPNDVHILEEDTFLPQRDKEGSFIIKDNTYCMHHGTGLWGL